MGSVRHGKRLTMWVLGTLVAAGESFFPLPLQPGVVLAHGSGEDELLLLGLGITLALFVYKAARVKKKDDD